MRYVVNDAVCEWFLKCVVDWLFAVCLALKMPLKMV